MITPAVIRHELTRLGFVVHNTTGRAGDTWTHPTLMEAPGVLVPREEDVAIGGYAETLESAIMRISWVTGESASEVAQRLRVPSRPEGAKRAMGFSLCVWDTGEIEIDYSRKGTIRTWHTDVLARLLKR